VLQAGDDEEQKGEEKAKEEVKEDGKKEEDRIGEELPHWEFVLGNVPRPKWLPFFGQGNKNVPPQDWGMTLRQWSAFIMACTMGEGEGGARLDKLPAQKPDRKEAKDVGFVDLYKINDKFVKPWTANLGNSIALLMNCNRPLTAEMMISHAWGECIVEAMVAVLGNAFAMGLTLDTVIWFCTFAQYQSGGPGDCGPTVQEQLKRNPFKEVIDSKPPHGMLVIHTTRMELYGRLWCVFEVNEADKAGVDPRAAPSMNYLVEFFLQTTEGGKTRDELCQVKTEDAECKSKEDMKMIQGLIKEGKGFGALDRKITSFRRKAMDGMLEVAGKFFQWAKEAGHDGSERKLISTLRDQVRSSAMFVGFQCLTQHCDAVGFTDAAYHDQILRVARQTVRPLRLFGSGTGEPPAGVPPFFDPGKVRGTDVFRRLLSEGDGFLRECLRDMDLFPMPVAYLEMGAGGRVHGTSPQACRSNSVEDIEELQESLASVNSANAMLQDDVDRLSAEMEELRRSNSRLAELVMSRSRSGTPEVDL